MILLLTRTQSVGVKLHDFLSSFADHINADLNEILETSEDRSHGMFRSIVRICCYCYYYFFSQVVDHIFLRVQTNFSTSIFLGRVNIFRI